MILYQGVSYDVIKVIQKEKIKSKKWCEADQRKNEDNLILFFIKIICDI
jgi:hypothetical protein